MALAYSNSRDDVAAVRTPSIYPDRDTELLPEYSESDAEELFGPVPPPPAEAQKLAAPLVLPQIATNYDSAFLRAYNPILEASGIFVDDWMKFIDGLNIAIAASPPLRVIDMAGMVIGFVPYHWCIIAGAVMQTAAQTSAHILSKTLTDRYLHRANTTYFEPRGLKVRLMKTAAMRRFVHADKPEEEGKWKKFGKSAGRTAEKVGLHLPIARKLITTFAKPAPRIDPNTPGDVSYRRLQQLEGFVMPVSIDVPPPKTPESLLDKSSALAIKLEQWRAKRKETKDMRNRRLLAIAEGRAPPESLADPTLRERLTQHRASRRVNRRGGLISMALSAAGVERSNRRGGRLAMEVAKADRLEMLRTDGLIWLVLLNAEDDKLIEGTELVDTDAPETIDDEEWRDIVEEEEVEDEEDAIVLHELNKDQSSAASSSNPYSAYMTSAEKR